MHGREQRSGAPVETVMNAVLNDRLWPALEGVIKKISYERRTYESVDEKSLYWLCPKKKKKKFWED